ncbi:MAG: ferrous iron transport protein B [Desulfobacterales bacterium]|nr:ferrous iron transport protein B [Desulfobacterales bacterium]
MNKEIILALTGQPNTGKSTIFNKLTGARQHVGNWPGKTVEKKQGVFKKKSTTYNIVDLPGTYSLTANSQEEVIARDFVISEKPGLIIAVVDASQLERSFYMVAEIIAMKQPVIIVLNMMDVAQNQGIRIDTGRLASITGVPVVPMSAALNQGVELLTAEIELWADGRGQPMAGTDTFLTEALSSRVRDLESSLEEIVLPRKYRKEWVAVKLLEGDAEIRELVAQCAGKEVWSRLSKSYGFHNSDIIGVAEARFQRIQEILAHCLESGEPAALRQKIKGFDRLATHPVTGSLFSLLVMFTGFFFAAVMGFSSIHILKYPVNSMADYIASSMGPSFPVLADMVSQGIIPGAYLVFSMSAFVFGVLLLIGFLEDVGYLPRMAYVADIFMNRLGLHGKSFIPLFMGFGCNIAAVMGTRVIDSARQRMLTIFLSSIIPCPGVLITAAFIISIFFSPVAAVMVIAMAAAVLVHLFLTSLFVGKVLLPGTASGMSMELPPYHAPNCKTILNYAWIHYKGFIKKGGTLIASIIIVIWALTYFPTGNMNESYLSDLGKIFEPLGSLMGMDWKLLTCLFVAFFSKEAALAAIGVIYGLTSADGSLMTVIMGVINNGSATQNLELASLMSQSVSRPSALAFVFAVLFSVPCYSTVGAIYFETKSLKWTIGASLYYVTASVIWGILAYNAGKMIFT